jgi:thiamine biosynthesis lipoprotein
MAPVITSTPNEPISYQLCFMAMTVPCQLLLVGDDELALADAAQRVMAQTKALEKKYNFYDPKSWLNKTINQRIMSQVLLDVETADILASVYQHSKITQDTFDICVGTLKSPFRHYQQTDLGARRAYFEDALGLKAWNINGRILTVNHPETLLDLGGVIKEYAVDKAMILLKSCGVRGGLVNFGGDMISWGTKADDSRFRAAIAHPALRGEICANITLHNQSLTTSGHGQRYLTVGDKKHSHVIGDTNNQLQAVSVVSNSALISGIYSSSLLLRPQLIHESTIQQIVNGFGVDQQGNFKPLPQC